MNGMFIRVHLNHVKSALSDGATGFASVAVKEAQTLFKDVLVHYKDFRNVAHNFLLYGRDVAWPVCWSKHSRSRDVYMAKLK